MDQTKKEITPEEEILAKHSLEDDNPQISSKNIPPIVHDYAYSISGPEKKTINEKGELARQYAEASHKLSESPLGLEVKKFPKNKDIPLRYSTRHAILYTLHSLVPKKLRDIIGKHLNPQIQVFSPHYTPGEYDRNLGTKTFLEDSQNLDHNTRQGFRLLGPKNNKDITRIILPEHYSSDHELNHSALRENLLYSLGHVLYPSLQRYAKLPGNDPHNKIKDSLSSLDTIARKNNTTPNELLSRFLHHYGVYQHELNGISEKNKDNRYSHAEPQEKGLYYFLKHITNQDKDGNNGGKEIAKLITHIIGNKEISKHAPNEQESQLPLSSLYTNPNRHFGIDYANLTGHHFAIPASNPEERRLTPHYLDYLQNELSKPENKDINEILNFTGKDKLLGEKLGENEETPNIARPSTVIQMLGALKAFPEGLMSQLKGKLKLNLSHLQDFHNRNHSVPGIDKSLEGLKDRVLKDNGQTNIRLDNDPLSDDKRNVDIVNPLHSNPDTADTEAFNTLLEESSRFLYHKLGDGDKDKNNLEQELAKSDIPNLLNRVSIPKDKNNPVVTTDERGNPLKISREVPVIDPKTGKETIANVSTPKVNQENIRDKYIPDTDPDYFRVNTKNNGDVKKTQVRLVGLHLFNDLFKGVMGKLLVAGNGNFHDKPITPNIKTVDTIVNGFLNKPPFYNEQVPQEHELLRRSLKNLVFKGLGIKI